MDESRIITSYEYIGDLSFKFDSEKFSGEELIEGYKLQRIHIPDPVVIQPVKGGGLILAAWGDEAEDEAVKL